MSRKRKRPSEDTEPAIEELDREQQVNGVSQDPAPLPPPLEFSIETLNQIHTACTTATPVQQPLLEGKPFLPNSASSNHVLQRTNFSTNALHLPIGPLQMRIETT